MTDSRKDDSIARRHIGFAGEHHARTYIPLAFITHLPLPGIVPAVADVKCSAYRGLE